MGSKPVPPPEPLTLPGGFIQSIKDELRLEAIVACVGFDDLLDVCLKANMPHVDNMVVVTKESDHLTRKVASKHGAQCVITDLYTKNGKTFNKGAALTQGLQATQYHGWKLMLDADIVLPSHFRRVLFNNTDLDKYAIYGADRVNVIGLNELERLMKEGQTEGNYLRMPPLTRAIEKRVLHELYGYVPVGYFQLFFGDKQYVWSKGTAEYDDVLFAVQWPGRQRHILPTAVVYHLCAGEPSYQENWDGIRRHPRL
jgi:hypothetical protein